MLVALPLATAAVASILTLSSGINILQTVRFARGADTTENHEIFGKCADDVDIVDSLMHLSRQEILHMFRYQCKEPKSMDYLKGDWTGILLDNNGFVMVREVFQECQ